MGIQVNTHESWGILPGGLAIKQYISYAPKLLAERAALLFAPRERAFWPAKQIGGPHLLDGAGCGRKGRFCKNPKTWGSS